MKLKAFMLSLMMVAMMLPTTMFAQQNSDDFFRANDDINGTRDGVITWAIVNNGIGQSEAPVGSGLLILTAAGAGYALARRKRNLKKGAALFLALALLIGMTNCKKNVDTISSVPTNGVYITLNVDGGSKVIVDPTGHTDPNYATVTFEDKDVIYVGNNGAYCGYLTYDGEKFGGTITPTSGDDGDYLHFYFMGNKGAKSEPTSVNISDQTSKYPVISYGRSESLYHSSTTEYSATLYNKCAIGKFTISGVDTDKAITITGMKNTVAVDFSKNGTGGVVNPYTYSKTGSGEIRLHAESNTERWAILLPQDEVTTATAYASGYTTTSAFTVPAVSANGYYDSGVAVAMASGSPVGAFTINSSNDKVFFAPGNLQAVFAEANNSSCTWQFAPTQYSYIGNATANTAVGDNCVTTAGTVDLFGWVGVSGSLAAYGINNNTTSSSYGNIVNEALKSDWGVVANAASLGGHTNWRTLTKDEWEWMLGPSSGANPGTNCRTSSTVNDEANARYTEATINTDGTGVNGIILFPDSYAGPTSSTDGITFGTINGGSSWGTKCTTAGWATLEAAGCVFLPAAGQRYGGTSVSYVGSGGRYWSSTSHESDADRAYYVSFNSGDLGPQSKGSWEYGRSVRLARVVE